MNKKLFLHIVIVIAVILCVAAIMHKCHRQTTTTQIIHTTDTIVKRNVDSVFVPQYYQLPGKIDTIFVFNSTDTLFIQGTAHDTVYIENLDIRLVTHDTIIHDTFMQQTIIQQPVKHWGFGVTAGVGGSYGLIHRQFDVGPTISVGVMYKF